MDTNLLHAHLLPQVAKQTETVLSATPSSQTFFSFSVIGIVYFEVDHRL